MNTFDFYQDRKVTCWERTQFSIEAESYKEALEIIKSWGGEDVLCFEDDKQIMVTDGETLYETSEAISPIIKLYRCEDFDNELVLKKIKLNPRAFTPCVNSDDYIRMIEDIVNFRSRNKVRFNVYSK